jgi:hypothetical protein
VTEPLTGRTAPMGTLGTGLLLVMIDIDPDFEAEFNAWYAEEHIPERVACTGFLSAQRYVAVEGGPKYLALYELENPEVLDGPDYAKLLPPTEWTKRVSSHFTSYVRNVYRAIPPEGEPPATEGGHDS